MLIPRQTVPPPYIIHLVNVASLTWESDTHKQPYLYHYIAMVALCVRVAKVNSFNQNGVCSCRIFNEILDFLPVTQEVLMK